MTPYFEGSSTLVTCFLKITERGGKQGSALSLEIHPISFDVAVGAADADAWFAINASNKNILSDCQSQWENK
jgi:hypothetical protein